MDPHEDLQLAVLFGWSPGPMLEVIEKYQNTLKKYPNPPAGSLTKFCGERPLGVLSDGISVDDRCDRAAHHARFERISVCVVPRGVAWYRR
jgi:hypothetical protein